MTLQGRNAIISGASQGLGLEIAKHFVSAGARVMICARDEKALASAQTELLALATTPDQVLAKATDVSDYPAVDDLVQTALAAFGKLDILVANAGVHGPLGHVDTVDWQAWCDAIDINLKGSVSQCRAVLPHFKKQQYGKILLISGGGATKAMPNFSAYAASKAALVRFAETLAEEMKDYHIDVNAVAPGAMNTRLLEEVLTAGAAKVGQTYYDAVVKQKTQGGTPPARAAELCTFLASSESDGITGRLISAVWDPWKHLPEWRNELNSSDIYTLRRIVPKDRGKTWDDKL